MEVFVSSLPFMNNVEECVRVVKESGADGVHLDIMDGKFVANETCVSIEEFIEQKEVPVHAHFMVESIREYVEKYAGKLASMTFHFEAMNVEDVLYVNQAKERGQKVGVAIDLYTDIDEEVLNILDVFDFVLLMTVKAGKGGQQFNKYAINKIKDLPLGMEVILDGGVNESSIQEVKNLNVKGVVVGSAFYLSDNKKLFIKSLKKY